MRRFRLDKILRKECAFPKLQLSFANIKVDAKEKGIIPKTIVLVNTDNTVIDKIDFRKETNLSETWFVPNGKKSYICMNLPVRIQIPQF